MIEIFIYYNLLTIQNQKKDQLDYRNMEIINL